MPVKNDHIICTQSVELEFQNQKENLFLQNKISAVVKDRLTPALENLFDEKCPGNRQIKIDTLDIDIGTIPAKNWEADFVNETIRKIRSKIDEIVSFSAGEEVYEVKYVNDKPQVRPTKNSDSEVQALIHFIRHGSLPWNVQQESISALLTSIIKQSSAEDLKNVWLSAVLYSAGTFERFVKQFPKRDVLQFFESLPGQSSFTEKVKQEMAAILLKKKIFSENKFQDLNRAFQQIKIALLNEMKETKDENIFTAKDKKQAEDDTVYYIENAGLVILYPFLQPLFKSLDYLNEKGFLKNEFHGKAVLLSQYLVTGETEIPEYHLVLNKILCGYPLEKTVDSTLELTEPEEKEVNDLLQSVIQHWSALKTTSIAGLRNSFLQRAGKLTEFEDHWLLQVEQRSYDILMNYLPWGISIIKLPWMQKMLRVEWNS